MEVPFIRLTSVVFLCVCVVFEVVYWRDGCSLSDGHAVVFDLHKGKTQYMLERHHVIVCFYVNI